MRIATRISFAVTVPVLILSGWSWTDSRAHATPPAPPAATRPEPRRGASMPRHSTAQQDVPLDEGVVDLYGNEVSDAVARYGVDPEGSRYELHSPHTELPRLGSPQS